MTQNLATSLALAEGLKKEAAAYTSVDIAVCPPSIYIQPVAAVLKGSNIAVGAQNVYFTGNGAFTGEISTEMLADVGVQYVILG
ncbi:MAG: triose-phosphate isomerase, partial [Planctomycetaceae bacterium]|nr:triose-phosphate isomerase [Planctomycetaceae bacterium]